MVMEIIIIIQIRVKNINIQPLVKKGFAGQHFNKLNVIMKVIISVKVIKLKNFFINFLNLFNLLFYKECPF